MENLVLSGVITLLGVVGFTSCASSDDDNGNDPVIYSQDYGKGVVTQFVMNIGSADGSVTRSTAAIAQQASNYRGIDNIYLIPMNFEQTNTAGTPSSTNKVGGPEAAFSNNYYGTAWNTLIYKLDDIETVEQQDNTLKKIYSMTLPVGTNNFLFYGKAKRTLLSSTTLTSDENALNGKLDLTLSTTTTTTTESASAIKAELGKIAVEGALAPEAGLVDMLNAIANVSTTYADATVTWKGLSNTEMANKTLYETYRRFTTLSTTGTELRAGSAEAIRVTIQELYRTALAQSRYGESAKVQAVATAIRSKIAEYFDIYIAEVNSVSPFVAANKKSDADFNTKTGTGVYDYDLEYYLPYLKYTKGSTEKDDAYKARVNFPVYQGLPAGAARLAVNASNENPFSYNATTSIVDNNANDISKIKYPAELAYFTNSALRASDVSKEATAYPTGSADWDTDDKWQNSDATKNWEGKSEVTADTRAVAMKNNVLYGVSLLKSTVKLANLSANSNKMKDNRKTIFSDGITKDQEITIDSKSFILTGILVGGQPSQVGWDFLPTTGAAFDNVVYDRWLPSSDGVYAYPAFPDETYKRDKTATCCYLTNNATSADQTNTATSPNYTLLLDNYKTTNDKNVNVALEFINNTGTDFYGRDNLIPVGGTFYLVGKLTYTEPTDDQMAIIFNYSASGDYATRFPAYNVGRIFIQDHTVEANFTVSESALKNAYSTIPDLRTVQMLFGLSVDLTWRPGITYSDPIIFGDN